MKTQPVSIPIRIQNNGVQMSLLNEIEAIARNPNFLHQIFKTHAPQLKKLFSLCLGTIL